jgi:hypothetical protein
MYSLLTLRSDGITNVPQRTKTFVVNGHPNPDFKVDASAWNVSTTTIYDDGG